MEEEVIDNAELLEHIPFPRDQPLEEENLFD